MASYEELLRQGQTAIRNMDAQTKQHMRRRLQRYEGLLDDPKALQKTLDRLDPITIRRVEATLGVRVSKADLRVMDAATLARLAKRLKAQLDQA